MGAAQNLGAVGYWAPVSLYPCYSNVFWLFQPCVISVMDQFGQGSFLPYLGAGTIKSPWLEEG